MAIYDLIEVHCRNIFLIICADTYSYKGSRNVTKSEVKPKLRMVL